MKAINTTIQNFHCFRRLIEQKKVLTFVELNIFISFCVTIKSSDNLFRNENYMKTCNCLIDLLMQAFGYKFTKMMYNLYVQIINLYVVAMMIMYLFVMQIKLLVQAWYTLILVLLRETPRRYTNWEDQDRPTA